MKKEPQIFTTLQAQDKPVSIRILDMLEGEYLREFVREALSLCHDKARKRRLQGKRLNKSS
jgi:hypothetical protein